MIGLFLRPDGVGHVLFLTLGDIGQDEADRDGAGRGDAQTVERLSFGVGQFELGGDGSIRRDRSSGDLNHQPRPDKIQLIAAGIICLVVDSETRPARADQRSGAGQYGQSEPHTGEWNFNKHGTPLP